MGGVVIMPHQIIKSTFFCIFSIGDNVVYNLGILRSLYYAYDNGVKINKSNLIKPIIIFSAAIIEAVLYDFHKRIKHNSVEGIANLTLEAVMYIKGKQLDKLEVFIESAKKHDFFDEKDTNFYKKLDDLRILRNRIHIQNDKNYKPEHEMEIFHEDKKHLAEECLEKVLKTMSTKYPRPGNMSNYVEDMILPWDTIFI